jgi:hypothetical protein
MHLNGVLIGSQDPQRLTAYYTSLFGAPGWRAGRLVRQHLVQRRLELTYQQAAVAGGYGAEAQLPPPRIGVVAVNQRRCLGCRCWPCSRCWSRWRVRG